MEAIKVKLKEMQERGSKVKVTFLWTFGSIAFTEVGRIVDLTESDLALEDNEGRVSTFNLFNILDVSER